METIYLDVLFCVNFVIDYIILLTVKKFLSLTCRQRRLILGAAAGGLLSFVILLPPMPSGVSCFVSLGGAFIVVGAAFAPMQKRQLIKTAAAFFLISFFYCGAMIAVWLLFSPDNLIIRNSSVYIAVSPGVLIVTTVVCYTVLRTIMRITGKGGAAASVCTVSIPGESGAVCLSGRIDTGNTLKEPFSGESVIVVSSDAAQKKSCLSKLADCDPDDLKPGARLVPFTSVGGNGILQAIRIEGLVIVCAGKKYKRDAYIAVCPQKSFSVGEEAIVPAELLL